jgi:hypothetical protein
LLAKLSWAAAAQPDHFEARHSDKAGLFLEYSLTIKVNEDCSFRKEEYRKLKILKEQAKSGAGEYEISYEKDKDKIVEISAYTITPDGKKYPYTSIQDISDFGADSVYSDMMKKVVIFPQVNVGSIIESRVVIESKPRYRNDVFNYALALTAHVPTKSYKTTFIFPKKLGIRYKEFNLTHQPKISRDPETVTYAWEISDFYQDSQLEEYSPPPTAASINDRVEFSNIKSWEDYSRWYYALVQKNLKITPEIAAAAGQAILGKHDLKDKVRAILGYIQDNFRYVAVDLGSHGFEPHSTDEIFKNRYGDCKDLSLLCMAMLKSVGIASKFTLFQKEDANIDPQFSLPGIESYNHVLLFVGTGKEEGFYIDPQLKYYNIGEYPMSCQRAYTLIIGEDGGRFSRFPVFSEERQHEKEEVDIVIYPDGSVLSEKNTLHDLDDSIELRKSAASFSDEPKAELSRSKDSFSPGIEPIASSLKFSPRYGQVTEYLKWKNPQALAVSDGLIVIEIPGYKNWSVFDKENRKTSLFWGINSFYENNVTYHFPNGYRILSLPENIEKNLGLLYFKREYQLDNNRVIVRQIARVKQMLIPKEDYAKTKELFDNLPRDTFQRIILKKN